MKTKGAWPKEPFYWREGESNCVSIPFTWNIGSVRKFIKAKGGAWYVGGPAVKLMPKSFSDIPDVCEDGHQHGILQRLNSYATRTTLGCPNKCPFCGIGAGFIEPVFQELDHWPDLPVICDNNLLGASESHLSKVFSRLRWWGWADFNQGLDCRKITKEIAEQINSIGTPIVRVSLDGWSVKDAWMNAVHLLKEAGVPKSRIHSYVMIGYGDHPERDVERIQFAKDTLVPASVNAMWFHELNAVRANIVTDKQAECGWDDRVRIDTMRWSYGRGPKPVFVQHSPTFYNNSPTGQKEDE